MKNHYYYVYIMFNEKHAATYIGVTNDIERRVLEHKSGQYIDSYAKRKKTNKLAYYEFYKDINTAIAREKQLKNWHRPWKYHLIEMTNPTWKDLADELDVFI